MEIFETAAETFRRHEAERIALTVAHLRERGITTRQALVEMWAAENRERTVTRRVQGQAMALIEAEPPSERKDRS